MLTARDIGRRRLLRLGLLLAAVPCMAGLVLALERTAQQYERSLDVCSMHIGESLAAVYWIKGIYVPAALRDINYVLRDHHADGLAGRGACTVWCWRTCIAA